MRRINQLIAIAAVLAALAVAWLGPDGLTVASGAAPAGAPVDASAAITMVALIAAVNFFAMLVSIALHHGNRARAGRAIRDVLFQPLRIELAWAAVPIVIVLVTAIPATTGWLQSESAAPAAAVDGSGAGQE